jgi:hypothetical protein
MRRQSFMPIHLSQKVPVPLVGDYASRADRETEKRIAKAGRI